MSTPKELRAAPTQDFDKYVFTRVIAPGIGLFPVASSAMFDLPGGVSTGGQYNFESSTTNIGFDFKFNEKTYDRFVVHTGGFVVLRERSDVSSFSMSDYVTDTQLNETILDNFTTDGVLLCPWFDSLRNAFDEIGQLPSPYNTLSARTAIQRGVISPPPGLNPVTSGVKYVNTVSQRGENCLVIRWRSFAENNSYNYDSIITFEVVLYESGKIEFRYDAKKNLNNYLSNAGYEGATIGIFVNDKENEDSTFWRFRDFSVGLGHPSDSSRVVSKYGGCEYDPGYTDESAYTLLFSSPKPYNVSMFVSNMDDTTATPPLDFLKGRYANWPGQDLFGCVMTFMPPVNRRKVLPRRDLTFIDSKPSYPQIARTGDVHRMGTRLSMYDDRRSLVFGKTCVVDYPTLLPRDYANSEIGVVDRQNLYGDFEVASSTPRAIADNFIGNTPVEYVSPFSDHDRPEQHPSSFNSYYMTGSSVEFFGLDLKHPLRSKTQIKMEFPLQHKLQMFETGSAIYYYNKSTKGMLIPQTNNARSDLMNATGSTSYQTIGSYWPEDARCFGPIGNVVASGSSELPLGLDWSSDAEFGRRSQPWFQNTASINLLTKLYEKNVQVNDDYLAGKDEQISIPINQPFLLEKAVFELPMTFGPGWFDDKTTSSTPIGVCGSDDDPGVSTNVFDFAGPAITLSLFNQISTGLVTHRDLILTGTIIPEGDNVGNVAVRQSWITDEASTYPIWLFEPEGFVKYGVTPSTVVKPNGDYYFTGSVVIKTEAGVSNGVVLRQLMDASNFDGNFYDERAEFVKSFMTAPEIDIYQPAVGGGGKSFVGVSNVKSVNPFSRDSRGNNISGRSLYGKEYTTFQLANNGKVTNPLFVSSSFDDFPAALKSVLDTSINPDFQAWFQYAIPVEKSTQSPYLLLPGDNLVFALSKNRPTVHTNGFLPIAGTPVDFWRNGLRHDVWINTGSIKVTLYGSLLREGKEFHDTLNQSLDSNSVHGTIGMDPVCDQFQIEYDDSFYGTYTDQNVDGSMFESSCKVNTYVISTQETTWEDHNLPSRENVFSSLMAGNQLDLEDFLYVYRGYRDFHLKNKSPLSVLQKASRLDEFSHNQRNVRLNSLNERFYDSIMPDYIDCAKINESNIHHLGYPEEILGQLYDRRRSYGAIFFNSHEPTEDFFEVNDKKWNFSYPFEYNVTRKLSLRRDMSTIFSASLFAADSSIEMAGVKKIDNLLICHRESDIVFNVLCDKNYRSLVKVTPLGDSYPTITSMLSDDTARVLYGFGDRNTMKYDEDGIIIGHNHQYQFRSEETFTRTSDTKGGEIEAIIKYHIGPIIRGWKYGVYSGLPAYSSAVFNRNRFGHFRDMLEQRLDSKFYNEELTEGGRSAGNNNTIGTSPVRVRFINTSTGDITSPENTWGSNINFEAASSVPYFDGIATNRTYDLNNINQNLVELTL